MSNLHQQEGRLLRSSQRQADQLATDDSPSLSAAAAAGAATATVPHDDSDGSASGASIRRQGGGPTRTREVWTPEEHERFLEVCCCYWSCDHPVEHIITRKCTILFLSNDSSLIYISIHYSQPFLGTFIISSRLEINWASYRNKNCCPNSLPCTKTFYQDAKDGSFCSPTQASR